MNNEHHRQECAIGEYPHTGASRRTSTPAELSVIARIPDNSVSLGPRYLPGGWDVICKRGRLSFNHVGNRRFRLVILLHLNRYVEASRSGKTRVVEAVMDQIRNAGGNFVALNKRETEWIVVSQARARNKVAHALRDSVVPPLRGKVQTCSLDEKRKCLQDAQDLVFKSMNLLGENDDNNEDNEDAVDDDEEGQPMNEDCGEQQHQRQQQQQQQPDLEDDDDEESVEEASSTKSFSSSSASCLQEEAKMVKASEEKDRLAAAIALAQLEAILATSSNQRRRRRLLCERRRPPPEGGVKSLLFASGGKLWTTSHSLVPLLELARIRSNVNAGTGGAIFPAGGAAARFALAASSHY